jgi:hypothetical protein
MKFRHIGLSVRLHISSYFLFCESNAGTWFFYLTIPVLQAWTPLGAFARLTRAAGVSGRLCQLLQERGSRPAIEAPLGAFARLTRAAGVSGRLCQLLQERGSRPAIEAPLGAFARRRRCVWTPLLL